jgi:uroporphyrinogen III methyltransferase/synthase
MPKVLAHQTILVTRSAAQSNEFTDLLEAQGAIVIEMPTLEIGPPSSWVALDGAIEQLPQFHWLILTSANGVEAFFDRLAAQGKTVHDLKTLKIAVVGKKTAAVLKRYDRDPDFVPPDFVADALIEQFPDRLINSQILFPRVESGGREVLVQAFTAQGAKVTEVPAYESRCPQTIAPQAFGALQHRTLSGVTFASSKTVKHFCELLAQGFGGNWLSILEGVWIASIGPQTSKTCQELLGRVDIEAQEYTLEGLVQAIIRYKGNH